MFNQQNQLAMNTKVQEDSQLWHRRFGHFNYATLKHMQTQQIVENLPQIQENDAVCQTCQFGRLKRQPFSIDIPRQDNGKAPTSTLKFVWPYE